MCGLLFRVVINVAVNSVIGHLMSAPSLLVNSVSIGILIMGATEVIHMLQHAKCDAEVPQ